MTIVETNLNPPVLPTVSHFLQHVAEKLREFLEENKTQLKLKG